MRQSSPDSRNAQEEETSGGTTEATASLARIVSRQDAEITQVERQIAA
jgi:hypothetical protein